MLNISTETLKVLEIWSGLLNISPETFKGSGSGRVSQVLKEEICNQLVGVGFLEVGRDPCLTARAIESSGGRLCTIGLGGWVGHP